MQAGEPAAEAVHGEPGDEPRELAQEVDHGPDVAECQLNALVAQATNSRPAAEISPATVSGLS
jgi:hypothetical protein